jgi:hypothetical protein
LHAELSATAARLCFRLRSIRRGQELLPAVVAAKVERFSIALGVERGGFIHGHSADRIFGHSFRFFHGFVSFLVVVIKLVIQRSRCCAHDTDTETRKRLNQKRTRAPWDSTDRRRRRREGTVRRIKAHHGREDHISWIRLAGRPVFGGGEHGILRLNKSAQKVQRWKEGRFGNQQRLGVLSSRLQSRATRTFRAVVMMRIA